MVNITVYQNGDVSGDNGRVIGYEGQSYSNAITIVHPLFSGAEYYIEYKYSQTIFRDKLDANNMVKLRIEKPGYLKCQFVAIDVLSGEILFKSHAWNFLVQEAMTTEPSHYPCSSFLHNSISNNSHCWNHSNYRTHHCNGGSNNNNMDSYEAYYKLLTELRNEEDIRFNETQKLIEEIREIKNALNITVNVPSVLDANEIIQPGKYVAAIGSANFPANNQEFLLEVSSHNGHFIQRCFECDGDNIWYRTGEQKIDNVAWTNWAENITRVTEI